MSFRKDFLWGAASAATQVEGAYDEDGKCLSIWDVAGDRIRNNEDCHTACDHYHRYKEDVALMKKIGLKSYRFSINMCRIMTGENKVNKDGLNFYRNLIRELKENGIEPLVTLYHWDLPQWFQEKGGWKNDAIQELYLDYVKIVVSEFKDDVKYWITFNEPQMFIMMGYVTGTSAPFKRQVFSFRRHHMRNMLMAHGRAVKLIREICPDAKVGIAMASTTYIPDSESAEDIRKAAELSFESTIGEGSNGLYMDPIALGKATKLLSRTLSKEDLKIISEPIDFIGLNVYQPSNGMIDKKKYDPDSREKTSMGWVIDERCLYWTVRHYYDRYHLPIMITENGMADNDVLSDDGKCHDEKRVSFIRRFLSSSKRAADEGIPVLGYQYWSIMDNFEWCDGYGPRFGITYIDYKTQERVLKDSAYAYQQIIENNGENL